MATELVNYVIAATGTLYIPSAGNYTFDVNSDDGFSLTITGATFTSFTNRLGSNPIGSNAMEYDGGRGTADTSAWPTSPTPATTRSASSSSRAAAPRRSRSRRSRVTYTSWNSIFELVGDTANGGLSLGSLYVPPPFTVGVNAKSTNDTSPSLTGT